MRTTFVLFVALSAGVHSHATTPPEFEGTNLTLVQTEDVADRALDMDLDRFERPHVVYVLPQTLAGDRHRARLNYRRFDGTGWRELPMADLEIPRDGDGANGEGYLALALSERSAPQPRANALFVDRRGAADGDDLLRFATLVPGAAPNVETLHAGPIGRGIQLRDDGDVLHAAWLDRGAQRVRYGRHSGGTWTLQWVSPPGEAPSRPSLVTTATGQVLIAYVNGSTLRLWERLPSGFALRPLSLTAIGSVELHRFGQGVGLLYTTPFVNDVQHLRYRPIVEGTEDVLLSTGGFELVPRRALADIDDGQPLALVRSGEESIAFGLGKTGFVGLSDQYLLAHAGSERHLMGFDADGHGDVVYLRRGQTWSAATAALPSGEPVLRAVALPPNFGNDADPSLRILLGGAAPALASWVETENRIVRDAVALPPGALGVDIDYQFAFGERLAYRSGGLRLASRSDPSSAWTTSVVDPVPASGVRPQLHIDATGIVRIVHGSGGQLRLTEVRGESVVHQTLWTASGAAELAASRWRSASVAISGDIYVVLRVGNLTRLLWRRPSGTITTLDEQPSSGAVAHDVAVDADGLPVWAFATGTSTGTLLWMRRREADATIVAETVRGGGIAQPVIEVDLELKNGSASLARIAAIDAFDDGMLFLYQRRIESDGSGNWFGHGFGNFAAADASVVLNTALDDAVIVSAGDGRLGGTSLLVSLRRQQGDDQVAAQGAHPNRFGSSFYCRCPGNEIDSEVALATCRLEREKSISGDSVSALLRQRFAQSAAGRYYLALYEEHGDEITRLTLANPAHMLQRARTMSDFLPGLALFAEGDGTRVMTPAMLANARQVWRGWAASGSPRLRSAVENELARLDELRDFENMSFDQWFAALTVGNATDRIASDGFE